MVNLTFDKFLLKNVVNVPLIAQSQIGVVRLGGDLTDAMGIYV